MDCNGIKTSHLKKVCLALFRLLVERNQKIIYEDLLCSITHVLITIATSGLVAQSTESIGTRHFDKLVKP